MIDRSSIVGVIERFSLDTVISDVLQVGRLIEEHITNGSIVPVEITCKLLENVSIRVYFELKLRGVDVEEWCYASVVYEDVLDVYSLMLASFLAEFTLFRRHLTLSPSLHAITEN